MGQVLHGSAKTTHAVRAAIRRSKATTAEVAATHGVNAKTVIKWRRLRSWFLAVMTMSRASGAVTSFWSSMASGTGGWRKSRPRWVLDDEPPKVVARKLWFSQPTDDLSPARRVVRRCGQARAAALSCRLPAPWR